MKRAWNCEPDNIFHVSLHRKWVQVCLRIYFNMFAKGFVWVVSFICVNTLEGMMLVGNLCCFCNHYRNTYTVEIWYNKIKYLSIGFGQVFKLNVIIEFKWMPKASKFQFISTTTSLKWPLKKACTFVKSRNCEQPNSTVEKKRYPVTGK